jgi:hypothetical protein
MSVLWFDPHADPVEHRAPRSPLDPTRPIRRVTGGTIKVELSDYCPSTFDWSNFIGGIYVAPETDPA